MTPTEFERPQHSGVWGTFVGSINQDALYRLFNTISRAVSGGETHIHLLFQSAGGTVGDGVALYNYFRTLPVKLSLYNGGSVASIATIAYLGARCRLVSSHATFMIHRGPSLARKWRQPHN